MLGCSPVSPKEEQSWDVGCPPAAVLDHLHVGTVIVVRIVGNDHCSATMLLDNVGFGQERAAPVGERARVAGWG